MTENIGHIDRMLRVAVGFALVAFALGLGFPPTGWSWIGWIGIVPMATAIMSYCPAYTAFGVSSCAQPAH